jgi:hypothetical protein
VAHLVEKVTYLEEQLKSKVEQLQMRAGQWFWIKPNQQVLQNVKRWGMVGFCL